MDREIAILYYMDTYNKVHNIPSGFWDGEDGKERFKMIFKYIVEDLCGQDEDTFIKDYSSKWIRKYRLSVPLTKHFDDKLFNAVDYVYPNKFMPWQVNGCSSVDFNSNENKAIALRWLLNKLNITEKDVIAKLKYDDFLQNGLGALYRVHFKRNKMDIVRFLMENKEFCNQEIIKPNFKKVKKPNNNNNSNLDHKIRELIDNGDDNIEGTIAKIHQEIEKTTRYKGQLKRKYNNDLYKAINTLYPNKYHIKHFIKYNSSMGKLNVEQQVEILKYLFEDKLKWNEVDINENLSLKVFEENGLSQFLSKYCNNSPLMAVKKVYPNFKYRIY